MHVGDDQIIGSEWFEENILPQLRKRFVYGTWVVDAFTYCGRDSSRKKGGTAVIGQEGYVMGIPGAKDAQSRRKERQAARSWRPKFAFEVARLQCRVEVATVKDAVDAIRVIDGLKRNAKAALQILPVVLEVLSLGHSSSMSMDAKERATQAGYAILFRGPEIEKSGTGKVSAPGW